MCPCESATRSSCRNNQRRIEAGLRYGLLLVARPATYSL
jgi:hypothetical protein